MFFSFKINCLWSPRGLFLVRPCFRDNPSFDRIWSWKSGNVTLKIHDTVCARQPLPERVGLFWGLTAMGLEFVRNGTSRLPFRPIYLVCSRFCDYRKVPRTKDPLGINTEMKFLDPTKNNNHTGIVFVWTRANFEHVSWWYVSFRVIHDC